MTDIQITPLDVNCPVCAARVGQSCQERDGFVSPAHASRQIAAVAALVIGEHVSTRVFRSNVDQDPDLSGLLEEARHIFPPEKGE